MTVQSHVDYGRIEKSVSWLQMALEKMAETRVKTLLNMLFNFILISLDSPV